MISLNVQVHESAPPPKEKTATNVPKIQRPRLRGRQSSGYPVRVFPRAPAFEPVLEWIRLKMRLLAGCRTIFLIVLCRWFKTHRGLSTLEGGKKTWDAVISTLS